MQCYAVELDVTRTKSGYVSVSSEDVYFKDSKTFISFDFLFGKNSTICKLMVISKKLLPEKTDIIFKMSDGTYIRFINIENPYGNSFELNFSYAMPSWCAKSIMTMPMDKITTTCLNKLATVNIKQIIIGGFGVYATTPTASVFNKMFNKGISMLSDKSWYKGFGSQNSTTLKSKSTSTSKNSANISKNQNSRPNSTPKSKSTSTVSTPKDSKQQKKQFPRPDAIPKDALIVKSTDLKNSAYRKDSGVAFSRGKNFKSFDIELKDLIEYPLGLKALSWDMNEKQILSVINAMELGYEGIYQHKDKYGDWWSHVDIFINLNLMEDIEWPKSLFRLCTAYNYSTSFAISYDSSGKFDSINACVYLQNVVKKNANYHDANSISEKDFNKLYKKQYNYMIKTLQKLGYKQIRKDKTTIKFEGPRGVTCTIKLKLDKFYPNQWSHIALYSFKSVK